MTAKKKSSPFGKGVAEHARKRQQERKSYGYLQLPKGLKVFKEEPTSGKNRIRLDIIPYVVTNPKHPDRDDELGLALPGDLWYKLPIEVHRNVGADNASFVSPKLKGKKDPIVEYRKQQYADKVDDDKIISGPQRRNLYLVVPIGHKEYDEVIHIWDIANGNFQAELDQELNENPDLGIFPSLEDGLTLSIRFNEETFNRNKYAQAGRIDFEERDGSYELTDDGMLLYDGQEVGAVPSLDELVTVHDYQSLFNIFHEMEDDGEEGVVDDEEEERPASRRRKYSRKPEEEERPRRTRRATPKQQEEKDEPDDDDDEEEEKPRRRRSRRNSEDEPPFDEGRGKRPAAGGEQHECPAEGGVFGKDWDKLEECETCKLFDPCGERNEELITKTK